MGVLAEAFSVVVPVSVLVRSYPGGIQRYEHENRGRNYCSDGVLTRVGFLARKDAEYFIALLGSSGFVSFERGVFVDVALLDQNIGPLAPCLWLEFSRERGGTPVAWHAASRRGRLHVPSGWERVPVLMHQAFIGRPFAEQVRYLRGEARLDWYQDRASGRIFSAPQAFAMH